RRSGAQPRRPGRPGARGARPAVDLGRHAAGPRRPGRRLLRRPRQALAAGQAQAGARRHAPALPASPHPHGPRRPPALMPRRDPFKGCDDFRRARRPVALTRRQVVLGGLSIYAATALAPGRALQAARAQAAAAPDAPVLVSVFLPGGCDLLSTVTPLDQTGP